jgi:nucleoside-diphosphate-sugar epimerase
VTTILPPVVLGPVRHDIASLDSINDSGRQICNFINGEFKAELAESHFAVWVDVRDAALAHVRAFEVAEAANKRFIVYAGTYSNREVANILWDHFPALRSKLPGSEVSGGEFPEAGVNRVDNEPSRKILGIYYRSLEDSVVDMTGSLIGLYKP